MISVTFLSVPNVKSNFSVQFLFSQIQLSFDWFTGKNTGKSHINWFPVDFRLSQPIETTEIYEANPTSLHFSGAVLGRLGHGFQYRMGDAQSKKLKPRKTPG